MILDRTEGIHHMENQLVQMGSRLRELRTVLEIPVEEMARVTKTTTGEYLAHEAGSIDSSFTFIYRCAERLGVDMSQLVTGESPKLSFYTLTRHECGMPIRRREGFEYLHQAGLLKNRQAEPFLVKAPVQDENDPIHLSTHSGQEFDYILKGKLKVRLDDKVEVLNPGDSIMYDSSHPHGMIAIGEEPCEFLAVVLRGSGDAPVTVPPASGKDRVAKSLELRHQLFQVEAMVYDNIHISADHSAYRHSSFFLGFDFPDVACSSSLRVLDNRQTVLHTQTVGHLSHPLIVLCISTKSLSIKPRSAYRIVIMIMSPIQMSSDKNRKVISPHFLGKHYADLVRCPRTHFSFGKTLIGVVGYSV